MKSEDPPGFRKGKGCRYLGMQYAVFLLGGKYNINWWSGHHDSYKFGVSDNPYPTIEVMIIN